MKELTIWTVGHSIQSIEKFIGILSAHMIETVADIRRNPGSRRHPQYNREALEASLRNEKISYIHIPALGGLRTPRENSRHTGLRNEAFRGYADHMETEEFREGITRLLEIAAARRTAAMCAEALWLNCHRSLLADYLTSIGVKVIHLTGPAHGTPHTYTKRARVIEGKLIYTNPRDASPGASPDLFEQ